MLDFRTKLASISSRIISHLDVFLSIYNNELNYSKHFVWGLLGNHVILSRIFLLKFMYGARALKANYRGQTDGRQVPRESSESALTQTHSKWSWMNTLGSNVQEGVGQNRRGGGQVKF